MLIDYIRNPYRVFMLMGDRGMLNWLADEPYLRLIYRANIGKRLNLDEPMWFGEKINWLKLYGHPERYARFSDKYAVRDYIAATIGEEYLVPLLGVWDNPGKIDFDILPERFVLKATHDSGSACICRDKTGFDQAAAIKKLRRALKCRYYMKGRERQYEHVVPRVLAEEYIDTGTDTLTFDYKVYCFNGMARFVHAMSTSVVSFQQKYTFFDCEWQRLPFWLDGYPVESRELPPPQNLTKMLCLAEKLTQGMPFMRVDFYEANNRLFIGEMTWLPSGGLIPFQPPEWERRIGEWLVLPAKA